MVAPANSLLAAQLLEKLNDENETLEQRIKLAAKVFNASNLPLTRKEELIFTWIIDEVISENHSKQKQKKKIFNFLEKCLISSRMQVDEVDVRTSVCEGIFKILQTWGFHSESCSVEVSQRCVILIMKSQVFFHCFKKNVSAFSKLIVAYFNSVSQTASSDDCAFLVQTIIDLFNSTLLKQDLKEQYAEKILLSVVNALIILDDVGNSDFERNTYNSIRKVLFSDQGAALSYVNGLRNLSSVKETPEVYVLLKKLLKLPKNYSLEIVKYLYPRFLCAFASNAKEENIKFEVLASLCGVIGFKPYEECINCEIKSVKDFDGISVLVNMLKVVNELNFSVIAEISGIALSSWLISLLHSFKNEMLNSDLLKVFREIFLLLDPIVAEQMLGYFVRYAMLVKKTSEVLIKVYCDTLGDIFSLFIKLNRIQTFLLTIFVESTTCLMNPSNNANYVDLTLEDVFPNNFCKKLSEAVYKQNSLSSLLILTKLHESFEKCDLVNKLDVCGPIVFEIMFELTSKVLCGISIEHTAVKEKLLFILSDYSEMLWSFGMALVEKPLNNRIMASYFDLCGTWGAVNLMVSHYSYDEKNLIEEQINKDASNLSYVLKFLPDITWDILVKRTIRAGDITTKHALFQLMVQKMSALREFEEGLEGPGSLTARFLLEHADDDWLGDHANSLLPFLGPEELKSLATSLSRNKEHHKIIKLTQTVEFQENNDMVAAMGLMLFSEIARKCNVAKRVLMKKVIKSVPIDTILICEANRNVSEEIKTHLLDMGVILSDGIQENDYENDFLISSIIERKLELLLGLPLSYLQPQTQTAILLILFAATKCLPYHTAIYDIIAGILDSRRPLDLPETICWPALLQWIATSSNDYPHKLILLKCLLQSAFRDSSSIGDLIHSLSSNKSEPNMILCTIIATNFQKIIKKKRDIDGNAKALLQQSCHNDLYSCINLVSTMQPTLSWLPVYHMALKYHLNPKNIDIDSKAEDRIVRLLPDYLNIIMKNIQNMRDTGNDDDFNNTESNTDYLEMEGDILMLIMQNQSKFNYVIPQDLLSTLWTALAGYLPVQKLQHFLQEASNDEFMNIVQNLIQMTNKLLEDPSTERKICLLWKALLLAQLSCDKTILRNNAVDQLCAIFLQLAFQWKKSRNLWNVHGLLVSLITSLKVKMTIQHVEMCLEIISATPIDAPPKLINKSLDILSAILRYRMAFIVDLIPQFLQRFTYIISIITAASHLPNICHPVTKLADSAFAVEKLANLIMKYGKDFSRVAHFAVSDMLHMFEQYTVDSSVKIHLLNAAFCLLSLCDSHSIAYQMRILPPASKEIFKRIHSDYCKHHKFTGKV